MEGRFGITDETLEELGFSWIVDSWLDFNASTRCNFLSLWDNAKTLASAAAFSEPTGSRETLVGHEEGLPIDPAFSPVLALARGSEGVLGDTTCLRPIGLDARSARGFVAVLFVGGEDAGRTGAVMDGFPLGVDAFTGVVYG
jgi:hypothetical protein